MSTKRKLNRHPLSVAWDRWKEDNPGKFTPETLGPLNDCHRYLENRLRAAFEAGWAARTARKEKQ